jgi:hypothetical protein
MKRGRTKRKLSLSYLENVSLVVVVLLLLAALILFDASSTGLQRSSIERESVILAGNLLDNPRNVPAILVNNRLDTAGVHELAAIEYGALKQQLGIEADFALYFEDSDGNLVELDSRPCIGSGKMSVNGQKCS